MQIQRVQIDHLVLLAKRVKPRNAQRFAARIRVCDDQPLQLAQHADCRQRQRVADTKLQRGQSTIVLQNTCESLVGHRRFELGAEGKTESGEARESDLTERRFVEFATMCK